MTKTPKPIVKHILPSEECFEISEVNYKGKIHTYKLYTKMTNPMNQYKLAEFYENEKQKGDPYPMDSILHFSIFDSAVKSGDKDLMNLIQLGLRKYPNTLSRVIYNPSGKDKVLHNYGTSDSYSLIGNISGPNGWIKGINDKKSLELLTGIKDVNKLNKISQDINGTLMSFWRVNSKPSEKIERVVGFSAGDGGLNLDAYGDPLGGCPAFRVEQVD
jgi:hypothetical protein